MLRSLSSSSKVSKEPKSTLGPVRVSPDLEGVGYSLVKQIARANRCVAPLAHGLIALLGEVGRCPDWAGRFRDLVIISLQVEDRFVRKAVAAN